MVGLY